jgi:hypothetical protein
MYKLDRLALNVFLTDAEPKICGLTYYTLFPGQFKNETAVFPAMQMQRF